MASEDAVLIARASGKPWFTVINDADPGWKTTQAAHEYLLAASVPVANTNIAHRQTDLAAMIRGMTGPEIDKSEDRKGVAKINRLWNEIRSSDHGDGLA